MTQQARHTVAFDDVFRSAGLQCDHDDGLPTVADSVIMVERAADSKEHESWRRPIRTYFRLDADGWKLVGLERMPDRPGLQASN